MEVTLWPHTIKLQAGEEIEAYNATIARSFRVSEIPVLIQAILRAHGFALDAREMTCPI